MLLHESVAGILLKFDFLKKSGKVVGDDIFRRVAQFGRALRSGRRGRRFESCHADNFIMKTFYRKR